MTQKTNQDLILEGIVKQFPKDKHDHEWRMRSTQLHKAYHSTPSHAQTLSDNDLAARVKRHGDEKEVAMHLDTRDFQFKVKHNSKKSRKLVDDSKRSFKGELVTKKFFTTSEVFPSEDAGCSFLVTCTLTRISATKAQAKATFTMSCDDTTPVAVDNNIEYEGGLKREK